MLFLEIYLIFNIFKNYEYFIFLLIKVFLIFNYIDINDEIKVNGLFGS